MHIYIVRHGYPNYEIDALTEEGKSQAEKMAKKFVHVNIDKLYVSSNGRAIETASYIRKTHKKLTPIIVDWAREDVGAEYFIDTEESGKSDWYFNKLKWLLLFKQEDVHILASKWYKHKAIRKTKMKEGYLEMARCVDEFMLENGYQHDRNKHIYKKIGNSPENIVIVAHGGFGVSFLSNLLDIPYTDFVSTHGDIGLTSISKVRIVGDTAIPMLVTYNDISHLD